MKFIRDASLENKILVEGCTDFIKKVKLRFENYIYSILFLKIIVF